ncbi:MAG: M15 family metallopeptidase [Alphaproteobacteria bacterium]
MARLDINDLVAMDEYQSTHPLRIELAYARADNHLFGEAIYRPDARLWLHRDLAKITCDAANIIAAKTGWHMVLYDGLRTTDAQAAMQKTQRVKDNPHWLEEPNRLLSPAGAGAHPRAMAIDIGLEDADGALIDMGCPFDDLTDKAHRDYPHPPHILQNRAALTDAMMEAAAAHNLNLLPLPAEWWDFRFPVEVYEAYAPLREADLPQDMLLL